MVGLPVQLPTCFSCATSVFGVPTMFQSNAHPNLSPPRFAFTSKPLALSPLPTPFATLSPLF